MKRLGLVVLVAMGTWACSPGDIGMETEVVDLAPDLGTEVIFPEIRVETDLGIEIATNEVVEIVDPWCQPGSGCFGDPCDDNTDCLSGWCVEHMGEGVCSQNCVEECPEGWSCQQVAGTDPDVVYICVSDYANLCKPCGDAGDCQSVAGVQDK